MRKILTYFIKYPIASNVLLVVILLFGYFGLKNLRRTFFPERASNLVSIQAVYPGASPSEIEEGIVLKIEDNLDGLTGIDRITSVSKENLGSITIEVNTDYKTDIILQDIKNEVARINSFPDGMEPPSIYILEPPQSAISFALSGELDLKSLKRIARKVEDDLMQMSEISKVQLSGFPQEEIEIKVRNSDLQKYQVTLSQIAGAVRQNNLELSGGIIKTGKEQILLRAKHKAYEGEELENIVVKVLPGGQSVRIKDIATVNDGWEDLPIKKEFNKVSAVVVDVQYTIHEDMLNIVNAVNQYLEEFNESNEVVKAELILDRSKILKERISLLTENGVLGFVLVVIILTMFLHPRLAGWVALGIPISFGGMFIVGALYGISINVISLFGMIIVVGILVDDAIVVAENIYQHYEKGKTPVQAAIDGTMEVFPAVFSAVLTTIIAFSIFFFIDGVMGDFFVEMGFVVIFTLLFSLIEGISILPSHVAHSKALTRTNKVTWVSRFIGFFTRILDYMKKRWYQPVLDFTLHYPVVVIAIVVGSMAVSISAMKAGLVQTTFFPSLKGDNLKVYLELQPGTSESITEHWIDKVAADIESINEEWEEKNGETFVTGVEKTLNGYSNVAELRVLLTPSEERTVTSDELTEKILKQVGTIPGQEKFTIRDASPFGRAISIAFFSKDNDELEVIKEEVLAVFNGLGTLTNIESSDQKGMQELNITLKEKAYALGLNYYEVVSEIRKAFFGEEAQRLQRGLDEVKVWVRFDQENRRSINDLENMHLTLRGKRYLVKDLVNISQGRGVVKIEHLDGKKTIKVEADLLNEKKTSAGAVIGQLESTILPELLAKHPSVNYSVEGQSREVGKTQASVKNVGPVILILILIVVILTFRSFSQAAAVFLLIPFGLIGVVWGHFIHDHQISLFSMFGMIALVGVMINDALVFITAFNVNMKNGMQFKDAIRETGLSRFRPIILTSLTTIAGLMPLIFEKSMQAQFLIPMAISIAYGLIVATVLTLVMLPAVLQLLNWLKWVVIWLKSGEIKSREEIEPAVREEVELNKE